MGGRAYGAVAAVDNAFAILFAVPPAIVYFIVQRWITSGLAIGGVKG